MASSSSSPPKAEPPLDKPSFQLTKEEKAVLLECRRNSIARGLPLGVASVLALRWFVLTGRAPLHVQRWRGFYYGGVFLGTFLYGVSSYKDVCLKKIMALENSNLADQVRKHMQGMQTCIEDEVNKATKEHQKRRRGHRQQQQKYPPITNQRNHVPFSPPTQPSQSHVHLNEGPTINQRGYSQDKALLSSEDQQTEQPNAFGGGMAYNDAAAREEEQQPVSSAKRRGRTFDEIREENRHQQLEQNFPRSSRFPTKEPGHGEEQSSREYPQNVSGKRPLRKNKYGDSVYEE